MGDRDQKGRFVAGNTAAANKPREYVEAIRDRVPLDKWQRIIDRAAKDAIDGDAVARAWLADRLIGKPPQVLDLRGGEALLLRDLLDALRAKGLAIEVFVETALDAIAEESELEE